VEISLHRPNKNISCLTAAANNWRNYTMKQPFFTAKIRTKGHPIKFAKKYIKAFRLFTTAKRLIISLKINAKKKKVARPQLRKLNSTVKHHQQRRNQLCLQVLSV